MDCEMFGRISRLKNRQKVGRAAKLLRERTSCKWFTTSMTAFELLLFPAVHFTTSEPASKSRHRFLQTVYNSWIIESVGSKIAKCTVG